jgi:hypothetical protein
MKEDLDRRRGRVRYPWRTTQCCAVYCSETVRGQALELLASTQVMEGPSALSVPQHANTANRMRAIF